MTGVQQQIDELRREQQMRTRVYPRMISQGKLRQSEADYGNACLADAIGTLEWCRDNWDLIAEVKKALEARS